MLCIINPVTNIYFHLAAEEYLLKERKENVFMLWRSDPAIVVGKHQTALAEFNYKYAKEQGIKVARRLSGGGTVYHDTGNLNFTFIRNGREGKLIDFGKYTAPIRAALKQMGITTRFEGHNNLTVDGLKISGNAEHIFKNRVLHHGTLLYSTDLKHLKKALTIQPGNYQHKGVRSVPGKVANIRDRVYGKTDILSFQNQIMNFILKKKSAWSYTFNPDEQKAISRLALNKYTDWQWIYGYSPKYRFQKKSLLKSGFFKLVFSVEKGQIVKIKPESDFLSVSVLQQIETGLIGKRHSANDLEQVLESIAVRFPEVSAIKQKIPDIFF